MRVQRPACGSISACVPSGKSLCLVPRLNRSRTALRLAADRRFFHCSSASDCCRGKDVGSDLSVDKERRWSRENSSYSHLLLGNTDRPALWTVSRVGIGAYRTIHGMRGEKSTLPFWDWSLHESYVALIPLRMGQLLSSVLKMLQLPPILSKY